MISDAERREVARRLRELPDDSTYPDLIGVIADRDGWYPASDAADRLADLIEPSEPEGTCGNCKHFIKDRFMPCAAAHGYTEACVSACEDFSPLSCDRDALLALADEMDAYTECDDERCGKLMPPRVIHDFARRIREALGV